MNKLIDWTMNLLLIALFATVLFFGTSCTFARVTYPSITDRVAETWTCFPDKEDPHGIICIDAAMPVCENPYLGNSQPRTEM